MKVYTGYKTDYENYVIVTDGETSTQLSLEWTLDSSRQEFDWGVEQNDSYKSESLAYSLAMDILNDKSDAYHLCDTFNNWFVRELPDHWELHEQIIRSVLEMVARMDSWY